MTFTVNPNCRDIKREMFFSKENGPFALNRLVKFRKIGKTIYCVVAYFFHFYKIAIVRCENGGCNKKISAQKTEDFNKIDSNSSFTRGYVITKKCGHN
jgi:hypothetical protein